LREFRRPTQKLVCVNKHVNIHIYHRHNEGSKIYLPFSSPVHLKTEKNSTKSYNKIKDFNIMQPLIDKGKESHINYTKYILCF